ncbi:dihydrodipicolinate synthase family protein [Scandinavium manionii]|uniref:dihydrodipicolinate synthase family protein n=1 Tax=Scandinavium manionii TaxID=2926520 RepID=UPI0021666455|nr:dihydrodipicolinate synthase family protein [Scandinavium manionii]MCS2149984.1 dihydrodipicolinate synthase family protein [Scandinavium manionii]MCS2168327.1 dihydrodipicolinate synthase family protein [Scandinavium manionii]
MTVSNHVRILDNNGQPYTYRVKGQRSWSLPPSPVFNRHVFAAAHVVTDPRKMRDPSHDIAIDWEATLEYRRYLMSLGFGVAEAMDTAQRGMGLDWPTSLELIQRSVEQAKDFPGIAVASGAGTDHLSDFSALTLQDVIDAYEQQISAIEACGGRIILMASRALAAIAKGPDDYIRVYDTVLRQVREPVIIHWLGDMFDPALRGYWGSEHIHNAMEICLSVIQRHQAKIDGIKISLLDKEREIEMRRQLPATVKMYTGDDFNYPELIAGDAQGYSHALLGILDAIAPAAAGALHALAQGDRQQYQQILTPTLPLARHIFARPTQYYKAGIVFLAWLNGHQHHFTLLGGMESARSLTHYSELFRLADEAGLLNDIDVATERMSLLAKLQGI